MRDDILCPSCAQADWNLPLRSPGIERWSVAVLVCVFGAGMVIGCTGFGTGIDTGSGGVGCAGVVSVECCFSVGVVSLLKKDERVSFRKFMREYLSNDHC